MLSACKHQVFRSTSIALIAIFSFTSAWSADVIHLGKSTLAEVAETSLFTKHRFVKVKEQPDRADTTKTIYSLPGGLMNQVLVEVTTQGSERRVVSISSWLQRAYLNDSPAAARQFMLEFLATTLPEPRPAEVEQFSKELSASSAGNASPSQLYEVLLGKRQIAFVKHDPYTLLLKDLPTSGPRPATLIAAVGQSRLIFKP